MHVPKKKKSGNGLKNIEGVFGSLENTVNKGKKKKKNK